MSNTIELQSCGFSIDEIVNIQNAYYETCNYFKTQFQSHLGEKVVFDESEIIDENLKGFKDRYELRQRIFEYTLKDSDIIQYVQSAVRYARVTKKERELIELANAANILFQSNIDESLKRKLLSEILTEFPEIKILNQSVKNIIEVSPPVYEHQTELMVKVYEIDGNIIKFTQYSLPYSQQSLNIFKSILNINLNRFNTYKSTDSLSQIYTSAEQIDPNKVINQYPLIQDFSGIQVLRASDEIIMPKIRETMNTVNPFIEEISSNILGIIQNNSLLESARKKYEQIFLAAIASNDINIQNENKKDIQDVLKSYKLLEAISSNKSVESILNGAEISVTSAGSCDNVSGTISANSESISSELTIRDIEAMKDSFGSEISNIRFVENETSDFKLKFFDKEGIPHLACPICGKTSFNLKNLEEGTVEVCPECKSNPVDLKEAWECRNWEYYNKLSQDYKYISSVYRDNSSSSIFDAIAGLIESIFGLGIS